MRRSYSWHYSFFLILLVLGAWTCSVPALARLQTADFKADPAGGPIPLTVHFISAEGDDILLHEWDFGDGQHSSLPDPRHTYSRAGMYTVRHTVKSPEGNLTEIKENFVVAKDLLGIIFGTLFGVFPEVWPSGTAHDFGQIRPGSSEKWRCTLYNLSDRVVQVTGISGLPENGFRLEKPPTVPLNLEAFGSLELTVSFEPEAGGLSTATLKVQTNAPLSPAIVIPLSGKALNYHITNLDITNVDFSSAVAVNNSGEVVGQSKSSTAGFRSFLWDPISGLHDISGELPGYSFPRDLNNAGQVVGGASGRGFIWSRSKGGRQIPVLPGSSSMCLGINDVGQIVGSIKSPDDGLRFGIFLYNAAVSPLVLDEILPLQSAPIDNLKIGNSGMVVGTMRMENSSEAFIWEADQGMRNLGTLGGSYSEAVNLNDLGNVVGNSTFLGEEGFTQGFIWNRSEGMKPVIKARTGLSSYPTAINNRNEIVGYLKQGTQPGETAFVHRDGITYYLTLAIPENSGWTSIERAQDINDHGQIVGMGKFKGQKRAFLMTPAPMTDLQVTRHPESKKSEGQTPPVGDSGHMMHPLLRRGESGNGGIQGQTR